MNGQQLKIGDLENQYFKKDGISLYEIFDSRRIQSLLYFSRFNIQQGTFFNEKSIKEIDGILKDIDKELEEN